MTITRDPYYRYYNCNIQCPRIKCEQLETESTISTTVLQPSGVSVYNGYFPVASSFDFTSTQIPFLNNYQFSGELTLYMKNDLAKVCNVTTAYVVKAGGAMTTTTTLIFQRCGNMTAVNLNITSGTSFTIIVDPAVECRWIFRGS